MDDSAARVTLHPSARTPRAGDRCDACDGAGEKRIPLPTLHRRDLARAWVVLCGACSENIEQRRFAEARVNLRGWVRG